LSDTSGIDFKLSSIPPVALGQISGMVVDSTTGSGVSARVIAFRDIWNYRDTLKMHTRGTYFADADTTGSFTLTNLPPGHYRVLAIPLGNYVPSFYSATGPTVRWKDATAIDVNGNAVSGINVYVMPMTDSASGYTAITGRITTSTTGSGVSGAIVYCSDANGNIDGYGITDSGGSYTIAGISPGTYNVFADVVGYTSGSATTSNPGYSAGGTAVPSTSKHVGDSGRGNGNSSTGISSG